MSPYSCELVHEMPIKTVEFKCLKNKMRNRISYYYIKL